MKKCSVLFKKFLVFLSIILVAFSCTKSYQSEMMNEYIHKIVPVNNTSKTNSFIMQTHVGHAAEGCPGCVVKHGVTIHVPCQGHGSLCLTNAQVSISQAGNTFTATTQDSTDLTNEAFFMMPDRSLYAGKDEKGNDLWLNIPEQLSLRDSLTRQFSFTGLTYTNYAMYENE